MIYFQPNDQVVFNGRRATFKGYWPDMELAMVSFENGGTTSVRAASLEPYESVVAVREMTEAGE